MSQQLGISSIGISKATRIRIDQLPALLGVVAFVLAVVCKRMQQFPTMLGATVHRGRDKSHKTLESMCNARTWHQQCWESCANGSNIIARSRNTRNVGSCWLKKFDKVQILHNNSQQQTTTCNRPVCKRTEQQCWALLANNVTSVCKGLLSKIPGRG